MLKSLFISKHASEISELLQFAEAQNIEVFAQSFLQFNPLEFTLPETPFDVIFFGSPRAVMFYQSRNAISENLEIAAVGGKTTELLESLGHTVSFNGDGIGSITDVAGRFQQWLGDRTVLFPVSSKSLGTISKGLSNKQTFHVECYKTVVKELQLEQSFDVYVFTSPSNVEGFFTGNSLPAASKVIAWGESTKDALQEFGHEEIITLDHPTYSELFEKLEAIA